MTRGAWILCISTGGLFAPQPAFAQAAEQCEPEARIDRDAYLRRLSLDLLGRPPTAEEYDALERENDVPDATIRTMLDSDALVRVMQRFHADLLWPHPYLSFIHFTNILSDLNYPAPDPVLWRGSRTAYLSDIALPPGVNVAYVCVDEPAPEPAFDPVTGDAIPIRYNDFIDYQQPVYGFVRQTTYFSAGAELKVCAIDARVNPNSREGVPCDMPGSAYYSTCGCGPNLNWCATAEVVYYSLPAAFRAELDWAVRRVLTEPRPYLDLLTSRETLLTGPAAHYLRYQLHLADTVFMGNSPVGADVLAGIEYQNTSGEVVERNESSSGILTSPVFLLRHTTARARVNRFDIAFLCQPYLPPPGGIGDLSNVAPNPNLSEREKCSYCHQRLEPRSVYFGSFAEAGGVQLPDESYPTFRQDCFNCAAVSFDLQEPGYCSYDCARNYFVSIDGAREVLRTEWGKKKELAFRTQAEVANYQRGPRGLVEDADRSGAIAQCLTTRLVGEFLHRPPVDEEAQWVAKLSSDFQTRGYRLKELIYAIVTSASYRRAP